ncbi:sugar transferase [Baekduia soli]|uniref:Sugar transferase n=1 Tax=Baekduia soli TaxID=496014 RepID=A0A5B8TZX4_9ACTN|nr:sugar transferase [Baekduia soli]QEC46283.1 sugar transferase [Baekduia soli]
MPKATTADQAELRATRLPVESLPERDVRAKRPPMLSFLLRWATLRRAARVLSLLALDLASIVGAIFTALALKALVRGGFDAEVSWQQAKDYTPFAFLVASLLFARSGLYAERAVRPGLTRIVASLFQTTVVALLFAVVNGESFSSYYIFYGTLFFAVAYVSTARFVYEYATGAILRAAGYQRRAVLVGTGEQIEAVAHALQASGGHSPVQVVGFVSQTFRPDNGLRSLGGLEDIGAIVEANKVDEVIIADPAFPQQTAVELVDTCHQRGVVVRIAPSTMEILIHRAEFVPGQSVPLFELKPPVFDGIDFALKRTFDVAVSSVLLLVFSPLLAASALAVRLTSRGPVLYRSWRPGIGGVPFACLKFRTMYQDADERQADLEASNEATGALFKMRRDPRITRVGRLLRRFSVDELPQLMNVLRGDMSLVGPRPLPQRDFDRLEDWHKKRYLVLPGITGLWQVSGRSDLDFDDLVRLDFLYLERWSVFLDLTILVKTVPAVFTRRGAF